MSEWGVECGNVCAVRITSPDGSVLQSFNAAYAPRQLQMALTEGVNAWSGAFFFLFSYLVTDSAPRGIGWRGRDRTPLQNVPRLQAAACLSVRTLEDVSLRWPTGCMQERATRGACMAWPASH